MEQALSNPSLFTVEQWFLPQQPRTENVEEIVDTAHLHQLSEGDSSFEAELLQTFVDDTELRIPMMRQALAEGNFEVLARQAHQIRGASAGVGVPSLQLLARRLETMAKERKIADVPEVIALVKMRIDQVKVYIAKMG